VAEKKSSYRSIFSSLADKDLLLPYLKAAIRSASWPESYTITVDSSPYYGTGDGYFHPSTHAVSTAFNNADARYLYYRFHPEHRDHLVFDERDTQAEMTMAMGSALHAVIQTQFQMAGILRPENVEVDYLIKEHHVRGRIDMIVDHPAEGPLVTEFKTINSRSFDSQHTIKPEWDAQLSLALHATGYPYGVLLALESGYPYRFREYRVPRNDELLSSIFARFDHVRESIALNRPPDPCCALGSPQMTKCPARTQCWLSPDPAQRPGH
jgi:hypothetical protein